MLFSCFWSSGEVVKTGNVTADVTRQGTLTDDLSKVLNKLEQNAVRGELDLVMNGKKMQFANMTYDTKGPQFNCNPGSVAVTALCGMSNTRYSHIISAYIKDHLR